MHNGSIMHALPVLMLSLLHAWLLTLGAQRHGGGQEVLLYMAHAPTICCGGRHWWTCSTTICKMAVLSSLMNHVQDGGAEREEVLLAGALVSCSLK